ncbi:MAG: hypothetical protein IT379_35905 [Deltaproteobacteria bacterium]|nr:hypothetical protein [Deltaproteobacteria bacterium]
MRAAVQSTTGSTARSQRRALRVATRGGLVLAALAGVYACAEQPTEIVVVVHTDVADLDLVAVEVDATLEM